MCKCRQEEPLLGSAFADYNLRRDEPGSEKQTEEECSLGSEPATEVNREKNTIY